VYNATIWYNNTCRDNAVYQKLYMQSKSAPEDGRIFRTKHVGLI